MVIINSKILASDFYIMVKLRSGPSLVGGTIIIIIIIITDLYSAFRSEDIEALCQGPRAPATGCCTLQKLTRTVLTRRVSSYGLPAWVSSELGPIGGGTTFTTSAAALEAGHLLRARFTNRDLT